MKFEIVKDNKINPKVIVILGIIVISLIGMIIYQSYALFKTNEIHKIVDSEVGTFSTGDIKILSVYVDGEKVNAFPAKTDGKVFEKIECTNSGTGSFDSINWKLTVSDISEPTSCNVYFITAPTPGVKQTIISGNVYVDYNTNMIPVAYTSSGATVKADTANTNATYKWFDYAQYRWANAVLVTNSSRETYKDASVGTSITEADILAYLVYVPRYRYLLFNSTVNATTSVQTINVAFENKSTGKSTGSTNGTWLTHPAFTFGTSELNGIWVGKFETSPEENNSCYTTTSETNCNITTITPRIKPNKNNWMYINISNSFTSSQYFKTNQMYGLNVSTVDSHLMKNMEWGAAAYLSQSQYGIRGNTGSEIYINNYLLNTITYNTLTGCSSGSTDINSSDTCAYPYPNMTTNGVGASTTGTIYGIYDMSGGNWEFVMGNMVDSSGMFYPSSSGFATAWGTNNSKYYDSYAYGTTMYDASAFARGKLGDATRETLTCTNDTHCGWNSDWEYPPYLTNAWTMRGGYSENKFNAGIFAWSSNTGNASDRSFRVALVVE